MPVDELGVERVGHVGNVEPPLLVGYLGVEKHVQEHVAELFLYFGAVVVHESLCQFVYLLDGVRAEAFVGLFGVPRALHAKDVEGVDDAPEGVEIFLRCHYLLY